MCNTASDLVPECVCLSPSVLLPPLLLRLVRYGNARIAMQFPTDEPVWRQVLRLHVDHGDLEVAHHAAAALAW